MFIPQLDSFVAMEAINHLEGNRIYLFCRYGKVSIHIVLRERMHIERQQNEWNVNERIDSIENIIIEGLQLVVLINLLNLLSKKMKYSFKYLSIVSIVSVGSSCLLPKIP